MALTVNPVTTTQNATPKDVVEKVFQSGAISDEFKTAISTYGSSLITNGTSEEQREKNVRELIETICGANKVNEIAARVRLEKCLELPSASPAGEAFTPKALLDYLKLDKPIVFYDLETAGVKGKARYKIVEFSFVKLYPDGRIEGWTKKFNPEVPIQKEATEIHGIRDIDVKDRPTFKQDEPSVSAVFKDSHLAGFNVNGFDNIALQIEYRDAGIKFSIKDRAIVDVMDIYHKKVEYEEGEKRDLKAAYKYYCGKEHTNAHQAKADNDVTINVLIGQYEMYPDLSKDVYELSKYCKEKQYDISDFVDPEEGKFVWDNGEVTFNFGKKHKGEKLKEVVEKDKGYLYWILKDKDKKEDDFSPEIKELIRNALKGIYPNLSQK